MIKSMVGGGGATVERKTGTFTTSNNGSATVNCGFRPDLVLIHKNDSYSGDLFSAAAAFAEERKEAKLNIGLYSMSSSFYMYDIFVSRSTTGFSVSAETMDDEFGFNTARSVTFNYVAVKYT